jgi:hypothetical protein
MTWGRGLFRLWVIVSVLWVAAVLLMEEMGQKNVSALLGGSELRTNISVADLVVTKPQDGVIVVSAENGRSLKFRTGGVVESMTEDWQLMLGAAVERLNDQNAALNGARHRRARTELNNALLVGLLPPFCLLVLGWGVLWTLRGFRGDAN